MPSDQHRHRACPVLQSGSDHWKPQGRRFDPVPAHQNRRPEHIWWPDL